MEEMCALVNLLDERLYRELLAAALPRVIHTEAENEHYIGVLEAAEDGGNLARLKPATPAEVVRELMSANDLSQADLVDVIGTKSIVSEVLSGKRGLSKMHIQRLSERFRVSQELFFTLMR